MIRKKHLWLLMMLFLLPLSCRVSATGGSAHLVQCIDVRYQQADTTLTRTFRTPEKMEVILNYLRLLDYAGMPETDPELLSGDSCRITVWLYDGNRHTYHLHAGRYLSRDYHPWEKVEGPQKLLFLLKLLPPDENTPAQSMTSAPGIDHFLFLSWLS